MFAHSTAPPLHVDRLQRQLRRQRRILGLFSHELRNPAAAISMNADLMREMLFKHGINDTDLPDSISRSAKRLHRLLDDMSSYSYCASHQPLPLFLESVSLALVAGMLLGERFDEIGKRKVKVDIPVDLPLLYADSDRLAQVLCNLVDNYLKYAGPEATLTVSARMLQVHGLSWVLLAVADDGPGIPENRRRRVFAPGYRLKQHRGRRGNGLGLYLSRQICRAHGGQMWIEDAPGAVVHSFWPALPTDTTMSSPTPAETRLNLADFGNTLHRYREQLSLSRRALAQLAGLAESTVRNIESGKSLSARTVARLQKVPQLHALFGASKRPP